MNEEPESEFYEDFGSAPPSEAEVDEMIARARAAGDAPLRRALKYHLALRHVATNLLQRMEEGPSASDDALLKLSRFIIRGEGGMSSPASLQRPWWKLW